MLGFRIKGRKKTRPSRQHRKAAKRTAKFYGIMDGEQAAANKRIAGQRRRQF